jgi:DNA-binding FrmR family transcriptional regulator
VEKNDKPKLLNRLSRIEGQVRGVARMVAEDRYCIDVLTQIQAVRAALGRVETELLRDHLGHCIETAITGGDPDEQRRKAGELIELLERSGR